MNHSSETGRLHLVDALRGFAIASIMLLHNIEHFDFYYFPENLPAWMKASDAVIWEVLFFLFSGKSFAMFALLFGLTFFIQSDNQAKRGKDFSGRFAWRMLLLFGFGMINSAFFQGDILTIYAAIGLLLIPLSRLPDRYGLIVAVLLLLQPLEIYHFSQTMQHPQMTTGDPLSWTYFGKSASYLSGNSFTATVAGNLTNGKKAVLLWNYENGRYFMILGLFLLGMLAGRKKLFIWSTHRSRFWRRILVSSSLVFLPLFFVLRIYVSQIESRAIRDSAAILLGSWANLAFMLLLVSGFSLLYHSSRFHRLLNVFAPMGRMSLTNYVLQSVAGAFIYYGFGLGLYQYTGATYGLMIGVLLTVIFAGFCTWWSRNYRHGPLEGIWHRATWIGSDKK